MFNIRLLFFLLLYLTVTTKGYQMSQLEACTQNGPLGMITGEIQDWQITASSTYPQEWDKGCHERYGRIYQPNGLGWCAKYKSASEWLQVDLGVAAKVTGIMTQGRGDGTEWVKSFMVSYSMDAFHWDYVPNQYGNQRVFVGNTDSYSVKHSYLDRPILARFIKFHVVHWNRHPSMRVEIIGCQVCKTPIALPPYSKLSASSEKSYKKGSSCLAEDGHIMTNKAWCAKSNSANQWLQFDVGPPTLITGVVTKGRGDTRRKHWVTRFRLSYSNDSRVWYFYKDATHLDPKHQWSLSQPTTLNISGTLYIPDRQGPEGLEFGGNVDKDIERFHYLNSPFVARFVRFHPVDWHNKIAMRAGMLGCPHTPTKSEQCEKGFVRINEDTPCVENMAYKKESWINNKRHYKRHTREQWMHGHAARAVDGDFNQTLHSCTILDNFYVEKPIWMVDLGRKTTVSGVVIITWQGQGQGVQEDRGAVTTKSLGNSKIQTDPRTSYTDYMYNLDQLAVYVDNKGGKSQVDLPSNVCGFILRLNDALFKPQLHVQCNRPITGRYLYIEAWGVPNRWSRLFSAVLCEVMVYA